MVLPPHDRSAFTLVELAIVLVIMGLLVGGVLTGRDLIRAAELRAVTNELNQYKVAIGTFKEKYMALPGDMPNAVRFWGAQAGATTDGVDSTCAALTTAATGTATCNGDGSGIISAFTSVSQPHETSRVWQHLANAGLVSGSYTGVTASGVWGQQIGLNCPASRFASAGWSILGEPAYYSNVNSYGANYRNVLFFGTNFTAGHTYNVALTPLEQSDIDLKIDDGKPHTGMVLGRPTTSFQPNCSAAGDVTYNITNTSVACAPMFITGY